ncbi:unnamed protein product, partial [Protopolystoma xenopodis]
EPRPHSICPHGVPISGDRPTVFVHRDRPHGHHHGHSHDLSSVRAIAYTIIVGDGLHNFCDGIAIGASFANDLRGGLSTFIAVFCHELPHELGKKPIIFMQTLFVVHIIGKTIAETFLLVRQCDFAVLLHAGMSVKTAIFYNLLSSLLCALGMILGVFLGSLPEVNAWLFMLTAGMFVYIALVDMFDLVFATWSERQEDLVERT